MAAANRRGWKRVTGRVLVAALVVVLVLAAPVGWNYLKYMRPNQDLPVERLQAVQLDPGNRVPSGFAVEAHDIVTRHMTEAAMPALSVAVARGEEWLWSAAYGYADLENREPATLESRFRLGSTSKAVTGVLVARLVEQGRVELDRPIGEYLAGLPDPLQRLTVRQLASHTAGIRHYKLSDFNPYTLDPWTYGEGGVEIFATDALLFDPGTRFKYSTFGYTLLSQVLAAATGEGFLDLLQAEVYLPAGMSSTSADRRNAEVPDRVSFYSTGNGRFTPAMPHDVSYKWAGGGLLSSAADLIRLGDALLRDRLMSPATRDLMWETILLPDGSENPQRYGLGWRRDALTKTLGEDRPNRMMHHGGIQTGGSAFLAILPDYGLTVAALSNTGAGEARGAVQSVSLELIQLALAENQ